MSDIFVIVWVIVAFIFGFCFGYKTKEDNQK